MKKTLGLTAMLVAFVAMATTASATVTDCALGGTVATVGNSPSNVGVTNGFDCTIGGLEFSNFTADNASNSLGLNIFLVSATVSNGVVTLNFNPNMSGALTGAEDVHFFFTVSGGINQIDLSDGGVGSTSIGERACSSQVLSSGSCEDAQHELGTVSATSGSGNSLSLPFPTTSPVYIFKDLQKGSFVEGQTRPDLTAFSQSFHISTVPEPMTLSMMGIGLLGLGLARRRQQGKK